MTTIYERNFKNLVALIGSVDTWPDSTAGQILWRFQDPAKTFMRLSVEFNIQPSYRMHPAANEDPRVVVYLSMAHWTTQNGDSMADPELEVRVDKSAGMAEVMLARQDVTPRFRTVTWPSPGRYFPAQRTDTNSFLRTWLKNLKDQGHRRIPSN